MKHNLKHIKNKIKVFLRQLDLATTAFVVIASLAGLFFVFSTPLLWGADETTHAGRVYQLAHGKVLSYEVHEGYSGYGFGGHIPLSLKQTIDYVNRDFNVNGPQAIPGVRWVDVPEDYDRFSSSSMQTPLVQYNFSNTAIYSPFSYIPSIFGFIIAAVTNLTLGPTIMLARVFDLIFYIIFAGFALYALRGYKTQWIFFAVSLFPTYIYQASIINADAVTNAIAFTLVALVAKSFLTKTKLNTFETYFMLTCAFLMPITKPTYIFLSLLILLIPTKRLALPKYARQIVIGTVVTGLLLYGVWQVNTAYLSNASKWIIAGVVPWWQSIDSSEQVKYILGHPIEFSKSFVRTVLIADNGYLDSIFGRLGFNYVAVPAASKILATASVVLALLISDRFKVAKKVLLSFYSLATISILAIFGTLYLTISEVGQLTIEGVQGRYFMPVLPVVLLLIAMTIQARVDDRYMKIFSKSIIAMSVLSLILAAAKFHFITWG